MIHMPAGVSWMDVYVHDLFLETTRADFGP